MELFDVYKKNRILLMNTTMKFKIKKKSQIPCLFKNQ